MNDNCITCDEEVQDPTQVQCYKCWSDDVDRLWPTRSARSVWWVCSVILVVLLLATSASAQLIGNRYGETTPSYPAECGSMVRAPWIYAHGPAAIGTQFTVRTPSRDAELFCASHVDYYLAVGFAPACVPYNVAITGTHPGCILNTWDLAFIGEFDAGTGVEYFALFDNIPNEPNLVGLSLYFQWIMNWTVPNNQTRFMGSEGLEITIQPGQ